jgi:hypothetical protein
MVVWFGYFFNRPDPWNLWTYFFLYGFFVADGVRQGRLVRAARALARGRLTFGAAIVGVFLLGSSHVVLDAARTGLRALRARPTADSALVSGIRVPSPVAKTLREKAALVRERSAKTSLYYFTASAYSVPMLSGVYPDLPMADAYGESFTERDFEGLLAWIERRRPRELWFDDPTSGEAGPPERRRFFDRMRARLTPKYREEGRSAGWEVWRLRSSEPEAP